MDVEKLAAIFEAVKVMPLRPTDVLVFRCPGMLSAEQAAEIRQRLEAAVPGDHAVILLEGGCDIEVLRLEHIDLAKHASRNSRPG